MQLDKPELVHSILSITAQLNSTHDLDILLNLILTEARRLVKAEAGSIFLVEKDRLRFCYVQNDRLDKPETGMTTGYVGQEMDLNPSSLAGYVAASGRTLIIDDVYNIPAEMPYSFNQSFDKASGYRTKSVLGVPLINFRGRTVGVLQLINSLDEAGDVAPFQAEDQRIIDFYAHNAAFAIERTIMTREMILRMIRMAQLRDPSETGPHANRVASYAAVLYQRWAELKRLDPEDIKNTRDLIRVAAMLHDVGKVAISDTILKKPARLDEREYRLIKFHTVAGARLFAESATDLDQMSQDIALNHHERWDGKGYPGPLDIRTVDHVADGPGKKSEDAPIAARVTALADVYDALISPRVYKAPWPEEKVLKLIEEEAGAQFDPDVVEAFFDVYSEIKAIRNQFPG